MFVRLSATTAAVAAAGMLLAPVSASAQTYSYQGPQNYGSGAYSQPYDYDQSRYEDRYETGYAQDGSAYCRSDRTQRTAAGGVFGAVIGAVAGSQLASRGVRTEGSVLGGVLGAAIGAGVGNSTGRNCDDHVYDQSSYGYDRDDRYGYPAQEQRYEERYEERYEDRTYQDGAYAYGQGYAQGDAYQPEHQSGCRTVESRTRTRDGRVVTRYEQSCPDRY